MYAELIEALAKLREAIALATMLRHRRTQERRMRRLVSKVFRLQAAAVNDSLSRIWPPTADTLRAALISVSVLHTAAFGGLLEAAYRQGSADGDRELQEDLGPRDMLRRAGERIAGIDATTLGILQALIERAIAEHWVYTKLAVAIRRAFKQFGTAVPQKHLRDRAELIAVTEIGQAFIDGQVDQVERLLQGGAEIEKFWLTVGDDRVSDGCEENEQAGWIPFAQNFPSGHRAPLRFPGCRCALQTRRKAA